MFGITKAFATTRSAATALTAHSHATSRSRGPNGLFSQFRNMFIQTDTTPNTDSLRFRPGVKVLDEGSGTVEFMNARDSMRSPLAKRLFQIDGVRSVMFGADFITITKQEDAVWQLMKPDVYASIMDFFGTGQPVLSEGADSGVASDTMILPEDSETVAMIKELLDTRIRPTIQDDGGDIEYRGFENGVVKLKLKGSCRTCDSSVVTLKNGIENMLTHYIPEVESVEQVLDEEEEISNREFQKLEEELRRKEAGV